MAAAIQAAVMGNFLHTYSKLCRSRSTLYLFPIFSYKAITSLVKSSEAKSRSFLPVPKIPLVVSCKALLQADWTALKCSVCRAHFLNLCKATFLPESYNVLEFTPYYVACEFVKHVSKTNLTETKNKYSAFGVRPNILKPKKGEISLNVRIFRLGTRQFVSHRFCFVVLSPLAPAP